MPQYKSVNFSLIQPNIIARLDGWLFSQTEGVYLHPDWCGVTVTLETYNNYKVNLSPHPL